MVYNSVAENVLGTIGTIFWCVQLVPQITRNYIVKDCSGLPPLMMFLWAASGIPFAIYFFATDGSIPLRIQPELFTVFCMISWAQSLYYPPHSLPFKKVLLYVGIFSAAAIGLEIGFILWLRPLYREGTKWPTLVMGIIASVMLAIGLIPPYFELAKRKGRVVGINFVFLTMDSLGAVFSFLSVIVGDMSVMSLVLYAIVFALEFGIFTSHFIWYITGGRNILKEEKRLREEEKEKIENSGSDTEKEDNESQKVSDIEEDEQSVLTV